MNLPKNRVPEKQFAFWEEERATQRVTDFCKKLEQAKSALDVNRGEAHCEPP